MDGVAIGFLAAVVIGFIAYKAVQMNKKKASSGNTGGGNTPIDNTQEKPKK
jgi:hypothetical protein